MAYDYIRRTYGVDPKVGRRITMDGKPGVIVRPKGDPAHLQVRFDGQKHTVPVHPTWEVVYLIATEPETEATPAVRIQRRRTKGWRMPPDTVNVTRPGPWGNPYRVEEGSGLWWCMTDRKNGLVFATEAGARRQAVRMCCEDMSADAVAAAQTLLRGKNLACFCPPPPDGVPDKLWCHAAALLEIANA